MASTLFCEETYRAAFDFDFEEDDLDFEDDMVVWGDVELDFEDGLVLECVDADDVCDEFFLCALLPRTRVPGASFTGSATVIVRPGEMVLDESLFHLRNSSTDTPKRSATVISVSPRRTV
jgi:hypothetical protein